MPCPKKMQLTNVEGCKCKVDESKKLDTVAGKAGVWYTIGNILLKGCIFLTLPIFTRLLSTIDFGIYNTYIAYEGILTAVLGLGLYGTVKNAKLDYGEHFNEYLSSVLSLSLIILFIIVVVTNIFYNLYAEGFGFSKGTTNCLIFQSFGSYLIYFYGSKLNIEFKYKSYMVMSCFNTIGNVLLSIVLILFVFPNERYLGRIFGSAIPLIILAALISCYTLLKGRTFYNKEYWKYACAIGLPLVPHVISQSLLAQFDRIMISDIVGKSEAGIYSYIYTICTITYVLASSLDNAWTPWVYMKLQGNGSSSIRKTADSYVLFFATTCLCFICVMPEVTKIIADRGYWEGVDLLIPLTLANYFVFLYMLPVGIEYYNKKTKFISFGTVSAALLNVILNAVAIRCFGYKAAAYTTMISYGLLFVFHWVMASRYEVNTVYNVKHILMITVGLLVISFLCLLSDSVWNAVLRYLFVGCILFGLWIGKGKILEIARGKRDEQNY